MYRLWVRNDNCLENWKVYLKKRENDLRETKIEKTEVDATVQTSFIKKCAKVPRTIGGRYSAEKRPHLRISLISLLSFLYNK